MLNLFLPDKQSDRRLDITSAACLLPDNGLNLMSSNAFVSMSNYVGTFNKPNIGCDGEYI